MWLLTTKSAQLRFFARPEDVPGGYAILSHVWGSPSEEDTFQQVQDAAKRCEDNANVMARPSPEQEAVNKLQNMVDALATQVAHLASGSPSQAQVPVDSPSTIVYSDCPPPDTSLDQPSQPHLPTNPRDLVSVKIRNFLIHAEKHGFEWAWADTCCIDKTSSAELTEAINSMFRYYALSTICYVYLGDVSNGDDVSAKASEFSRSRWHQRGWTLQELLAPKTVLFMSCDWVYLGDKYYLAPALKEITSVPESILRSEQDITDASVAARMSWASRRQTTRVEDEAYCLFGLFGINMPTLYGEGRNAFYRLQEEIMRTSVDTSLFVWGIHVFEDIHRHRKLKSAQAHTPTCVDAPSHYLLAPSPAEFVLKGEAIFDGNGGSHIQVSKA